MLPSTSQASTTSVESVAVWIEEELVGASVYASSAERDFGVATAAAGDGSTFFVRVERRDLKQDVTRQVVVVLAIIHQAFDLLGAAKAEALGGISFSPRDCVVVIFSCCIRSAGICGRRVAVVFGQLLWGVRCVVSCSVDVGSSSRCGRLVVARHRGGRGARSEHRDRSYEAHEEGKSRSHRASLPHSWRKCRAQATIRG